MHQRNLSYYLDHIKTMTAAALQGENPIRLFRTPHSTLHRCFVALVKDHHIVLLEENHADIAQIYDQYHHVTNVFAQAIDDAVPDEFLRNALTGYHTREEVLGFDRNQLITQYRESITMVKNKMREIDHFLHPVPVAVAVPAPAVPAVAPPAAPAAIFALTSDTLINGCLTILNMGISAGLHCIAGPLIASVASVAATLVINAGYHFFCGTSMQDYLKQLPGVILNSIASALFMKASDLLIMWAGAEKLIAKMVTDMVAKVTLDTTAYVAAKGLTGEGVSLQEVGMVVLTAAGKGLVGRPAGIALGHLKTEFSKTSSEAPPPDAKTFLKQSHSTTAPTPAPSAVVIPASLGTTKKETNKDKEKAKKIAARTVYIRKMTTPYHSSCPFYETATEKKGGLSMQPKASMLKELNKRLASAKDPDERMALELDLFVIEKEATPVKAHKPKPATVKSEWAQLSPA